jgi:hypothetical protein
MMSTKLAIMSKYGRTKNAGWATTFLGTSSSASGHRSDLVPFLKLDSAIRVPISPRISVPNENNTVGSGRC